LVVDGAEFQATDAFVVTILGRPKLDLGDTPSGTSVYFSPVDFTAAHQAATVIRLAALPFVPTLEQFIKVVQYRVGNEANVYTPNQYPFTWDGVQDLTITGANFDAADSFRVEFLGQGKDITILDTAIGNYFAKTGVMAHSGYPAPAPGDGLAKPLLGSLFGHTRVIRDNPLTRPNDECSTENIVPAAVLAGGITATSGVVGNTLQLTAGSVDLKYGVWMRVSPKFGANAMIGTYYTSGNGTIITAGGLPFAGFMFWRDDPGFLFIPINDPSKLYIAADRIAVIIGWVAI